MSNYPGYNQQPGQGFNAPPPPGQGFAAPPPPGAGFSAPPPPGQGLNQAMGNMNLNAAPKP